MKKIKILALFLALITAGVLFWYLSQNDTTETEIPTSNVAIATLDIPENTVITAEMVKLSNVPVELVLPNTYGSVSDIIGKTACSNIVAGEQVVTERLVEVGSSTSGTLAYTVTPGMRAITIGVNDTTGLKCMINPGDIVDIIAQYQVVVDVINASGETETQTVTMATLLLQQTLVLAVDQVLQESGSDAYTTLTLEVTPEDAINLSLSESSGLLRAVLRSPLDTETIETQAVTIDDIVDYQPD